MYKLFLLLFLYVPLLNAYTFSVIPDHKESYFQNNRSSWQQQTSNNGATWIHTQSGLYCRYQLHEKHHNTHAKSNSLSVKPLEQTHKNQLSSQNRKPAKRRQKNASSKKQTLITSCADVETINPCIQNYCHAKKSSFNRIVDLTSKTSSIAHILSELIPLATESLTIPFLSAGACAVGTMVLPTNIALAAITIAVLSVVKKVVTSTYFCMFSDNPPGTVPENSGSQPLPESSITKPNITVKDGIKYVEGNPSIMNPDKAMRHNEKSAPPGKSILYGTIEDAQKLLDEFAGTGIGYFNKSSKKEVINSCKKVIGIFFKDGEYIGETTRFTIHYANTGAHIVPSDPRILT